MQKIFTCAQASLLEKSAKEAYALPDFLMMENAARALADFILDFAPEQVLILCGKGNNGGDGYAVARLLQDKCKVSIIAVEPPAAKEAKAQYEICRKLGLTFSSKFQEADLILDCLYGTGFHGQLPVKIKKLLDSANKSSAIKVACDIPSGLYFKADYTITMGCQKLALYSDAAKNVCGKISLAGLGLSREKFEATSDLYLIEADDLKLPFRKKPSSHKGSYGHTCVFCGSKAGAAILAASAAMNFGSGLTSLLAEKKSALSQFKISPSLMLSDSIPEKTTALAAGSGFTRFSEAAAGKIKDWFNSQKKPAAVFDAGFVTASEFPALLQELNSIKGARIILTPHLAEFSTFLKNLGEELPLQTLIQDPEAKIAAGKKLNQLFPDTTVIIKSANTFIANQGECFVIADGAQSLAKGGSGDILAGLAVSLLAQGYSAKDAAITAAGYHAQLSRKSGQEAYNLTPEKLLDFI